jgi:hypothetical protein
MDLGLDVRAAVEAALQRASAQQGAARRTSVLYVTIVDRLPLGGATPICWAAMRFSSPASHSIPALLFRSRALRKGSGALALNGAVLWSEVTPGVST